jgi:2-iminobutanoate/2-iminopropanoate deaminase
MRLLTTLLALLCCAAAAEKRPISPETIKPIGPYSPGILTGSFLYVSGQGAKNPQGQIPAGTESQLRQCFENVKAVVGAAELTMEHVVYAQVYLTDPTDDGALDRVWKEYFPKAPPARSTILVARLPDTPVEMTVVAVRDLSHKKTVAPPGYPANSPFSPGVIAEDRMYLSGFFGRDSNTGRIPEDPAAQVELAFDNMQATLKAAGLDFKHMVFVNPYLTGKMPAGVMNKVYAGRFEFGNTPARATIQVAGLPNGANIEFTGVAVMDLVKRRAVRPKNMEPSPTASPCVLAGDTFFCSAKSGFIPGVNGGIFADTVETQLRQTMRNLLDGLEEAGMKFANVVASNVYLDNLDEFTQMNRVYAEYFPSAPPSRTTVQQLAPGKRAADPRGRWPTLEQISIIAIQ